MRWITRFVHHKTITTICMLVLMLAIGSSQAFAQEASMVTQGTTRLQELSNQSSMASNICTFYSATAHYANGSSPEEILSFAWDRNTGKPQYLKWVHGSAVWFLNKNTLGQITTEPVDVNYYDVNLRITTAGYETVPYPLKGKLTVNATRPSGATFAAILEGTGTAWLVADGTLTCS